MIDYGIFEFAAPSFHGSEWFYRACKNVGLGIFDPMNMLVPFSTDTSKIKVTTVGHPRTVLEGLWDRTRENGGRMPQGWGKARPNAHSFVHFVRWYLIHYPGYITHTFNCYKADTVMRTEDQPAALMEFLDSVGIENITESFFALTYQTVPNRQEWPDQLLRNFMIAERVLCERYEYF